jgi:hypothetical protein
MSATTDMSNQLARRREIFAQSQGWSSFRELEESLLREQAEQTQDALSQDQGTEDPKAALFAEFTGWVANGMAAFIAEKHPELSPVDIVTLKGEELNDWLANWSDTSPEESAL